MSAMTDLAEDIRQLLVKANVGSNDALKAILAHAITIAIIHARNTSKTEDWARERLHAFIDEMWNDVQAIEAQREAARKQKLT